MKNYKTNICEYKIICKEVETSYKRVQLKSAKDVADYVRPLISETLMAFETFMVLGLNKKNNTIGWGLVAQGGISSVLVDMRVLFKMAIDMCATQIIVVHNHPAGTALPSAEDRALTKRVANGCELLDIKLLDHVIITNNDHYSFADHAEL